MTNNGGNLWNNGSLFCLLKTWEVCVWYTKCFCRSFFTVTLLMLFVSQLYCGQNFGIDKDESDAYLTVGLKFCKFTLIINLNICLYNFHVQFWQHCIIEEIAPNDYGSFFSYNFFKDVLL